MPHTLQRSTTHRLLKFQVSFYPFSQGPLFSQCPCCDREIFQPQTVMELIFPHDFLQFTSQTSVFPQGECSFGDTGELTWNHFNLSHVLIGGLHWNGEILFPPEKPLTMQIYFSFPQACIAKILWRKFHQATKYSDTHLWTNGFLLLPFE